MTTFITDGKEEVANLLYNNMFPVPTGVLTDVCIDPKVDTYLSIEERFIRKNAEAIRIKATTVYSRRYNTNCKNYRFLVRICCDFRALEKLCDGWEEAVKDS